MELVISTGVELRRAFHAADMKHRYPLLTGRIGALPDLLPKDPKARRKLFDEVLSVSTAAGPPSEKRRAHLRELASCFGLDPDVAVDGRKLEVVAKDQVEAQSEQRPAPAAPVSRTPAARPRRRTAARQQTS